MKKNIVLRMIAVVGFVVLSVTTVHAGGGMGGTLLSTNFECVTLSGTENAGETVTIDVFGTGGTTNPVVIHPTVRVNNAVLECRQVDVVSGGTLLTPQLGDHLKCYSISTPGSQGTPQALNFTDEFFPASLGGETVRVGVNSQFLCTTAGVGFAP